MKKFSLVSKMGQSLAVLIATTAIGSIAYSQTSTMALVTAGQSVANAGLNSVTAVEKGAECYAHKYSSCFHAFLAGTQAGLGMTLAVMQMSAANEARGGGDFPEFPEFPGFEPPDFNDPDFGGFDGGGGNSATGLVDIPGIGQTDFDTGVKKLTEKIKTGKRDLDARMARIKDKLEEGGFQFGEDGSLTAPDGGVLTADQLNNPGGVSGASGFFGKALGDYKKANKGRMIAAIPSGYGNVGSGGAIGGGGGGAGFKLPAIEDYDTPDFGLNNQKAMLNDLNAQRDVAGMATTYGGDPIGVAGDNIFSMVKRRYEAKDKANYFLP